MDRIESIQAKYNTALEALKNENDILRRKLAEMHEKDPTTRIKKLEAELIEEREKNLNLEKQLLEAKKLVCTGAIVEQSENTRLENLSKESYNDAKTPTALRQVEQRPTHLKLECEEEEILIIGGYTGSHRTNSVSALNIESYCWTSLSALPQELAWFGTAVLRGKIYVAGGDPGSRRARNSSHEYDINVDKWCNGPRMSTGRCNFNAAVMDNLIVAVGGCARSVDLQSVEALDPRQDRWMSLPAMAASRSSHVVVNFGGLLYAIGGYGGKDSPEYLNTVEVYDPRANRWYSGTSLSTARSRAGGIVVGDQIIIAGGFSGRYNLNTVEMFDGGVWKSLPEMTSPRRDIGVVAIGSVVYAVGGRRGNGTSIESLDITSVADAQRYRWSKLDVRIGLSRAGAGVVAVSKML